MTRCVGLFLVLFITASSIRSERFLDSTEIASARQLQAHILNEEFRQAEALAEQYPDGRVGRPLARLFVIASRMGEMTARESNLYGDGFKRLIDSTIANLDSALTNATGRKAAWLLLVRGHASAYRSLWESRFGSFFSAVKHGLKARDDFKRGLDRDSSLYDLYFGLGSFHYWKSARAGVLRWLGLFSDDKQQGIEELRLAADSAVLFGEAARQAMIWIWLDMKRYDSAIAVAEQAAEQYAGGSVFLWPLAEACFESRKYRRALRLYQDLRERLVADSDNFYNLIECDYRLALCYEALRETDRAILVAEGVRKYVADAPRRVRQRHRRNLAYLDRLARL